MVSEQAAAALAVCILECRHIELCVVELLLVVLSLQGQLVTMSQASFCELTLHNRALVMCRGLVQ